MAHQLKSNITILFITHQITKGLQVNEAVLLDGKTNLVKPHSATEGVSHD
jgi:hypothetical protein